MREFSCTAASQAAQVRKERCAISVLCWGVVSALCEGVDGSAYTRTLKSCIHHGTH